MENAEEKPPQPLITQRTVSADSGDSARSGESAISTTTTVWASPMKAPWPHLQRVPLLRFDSSGTAVAGEGGAAHCGNAMHLAGLSNRLSDLEPDEFFPALGLFVETCCFIVATVVAFAFRTLRNAVGYGMKVAARVGQRGKRIVAGAVKVTTRVMLSALLLAVVGGGGCNK